MGNKKQEKNERKRSGGGPGGDSLYALGIFGAGVYFWQRADTNGDRALAVLKAVVWPSFMVYEAFSVLDQDCPPGR